MNSCILMQELFSKQKGFLEEELDYRKQALDQAYMVRSLHWSDLLHLTEFTLENIQKQNIFVCFVTSKGILIVALNEVVHQVQGVTMSPSSFQHETRTFKIPFNIVNEKHAS